jgi:hypothetical protein
LGFTWLAWCLAGIFLYLLPGWGILQALWPGWNRLGWPEKLGLAGGASLAIYPLLLLWTDLAGWHWGAVYAWLPGLLGLGLLLRNWRKMAAGLAEWRSNLRGLTARPGFLPALLAETLLIACLGLIFAARFWAIRPLVAPMWGDSYQHTVIAQLLLDHGGLFTSWEPYAPYRSLTIQYGFSAQVAILAWLTRLPAPQAALVAGQLINGLAVVALLPLALRLGWGNRWAGVGALLLAGLLFPLPAYYLNWGRYAQLAGQAILPVGLWMVWDACDGFARRSPGEPGWQEAGPSAPLRKTWLPAVLSGMALAGMLLSYYRMAFFYLLFVIAWLVGWGLPRWRLDGRRWLSSAIFLGMVAASGFLLILPWLGRATGGRLVENVESGVRATFGLEFVLNDLKNTWLFTRLQLPVAFLLVGILALAWGMARKRWDVLAVSAWFFLLLLYAAGVVIDLPLANMLQIFSILIALYIPLGLLAGWLTAEVAAWATGRWRTAGAAALAVALLSLALAGANQSRKIAQVEAYALVKPADIPAMAWIRENTPQEAHFLVEGFRIYNGKSAVGADAGWWIPLLAGRANSMPPQYALLNEAPEPPDYSRRVTELVAALEENSPASAQGLALLCAYGITHVYIGQGQGLVGAGAVQLFAPDDFINSPAFRQVYQQDGVTIFALEEGICPVK